MFNIFRGHQTPAFHELLEKNNINHIKVPTNCTDKLQPLNLSANKPLKDEMKECFQAWYAELPFPMSKLTLVHPYQRVPKSANWLIGALDSLSRKPEIVINVSERMPLLMHLKLMDSRTLPVTMPSEAVSALCIQKTFYTTITLSIHVPWQCLLCHNEDIL